MRLRDRVRQLALPGLCTERERCRTNALRAIELLSLLGSILGHEVSSESYPAGCSVRARTTARVGITCAEISSRSFPHVSVWWRADDDSDVKIVEPLVSALANFSTQLSRVVRRGILAERSYYEHAYITDFEFEVHSVKEVQRDGG